MNYHPEHRSQDCIRLSERRYTYAKRRLRQAGITFVPGETKGFGFWIDGAINPRTGSTWHSPDEARSLVNEKTLA
jgi:hypothetical protein